ncbi:MAG: TetR/AcrR family transcriptional regulator [Gammaproteobacteria bacterium]|jgi:AcrR family transcriptional regulator|nr:TetR/AcrR family transcriptional regulator [Gammaproteobacteria bacterium]MCP4879272.1 TetR/AcrR family transcriptional regulator [Gammaproteobacteria bacterium]MDP6165087.1 TetR/AcrR family transcriptional regulator [Gammaproteobacteria bacterium]
MPITTKDNQLRHTKATREDWLQTALGLLITKGEEAVRIQTIGAKLGVSRSSFYWYFNDRQDLLMALLGHWQQQNTLVFIKQTQGPAATITEAVCRIFYCAIDTQLFDTDLDFAVREWGRRSDAVMAQVREADQQCLAALTAMYVRFSYAPQEAEVRARMLYFTQVGYHLVDLQESMVQRLTYLRGYIVGFTGQEPQAEELEEFITYTQQLPA